MDLPTIFTSPYAVTEQPENCLCGQQSGVTVNVNPFPMMPLNENGTVVVRQEQASRLLEIAKRQGFPIFQGS